MGGITQSLFRLRRAVRAPGSSCGMGGGGAGEGAAHRARAQGKGMGEQCYLGGASAPHGNRDMVWLASGIPGGDSKCPTHPWQPPGSPVLLRPAVGLPGPVGPGAASGAGCKRRGGGQGGWGGGTQGAQPPTPHPQPPEGDQPGDAGSAARFRCRFRLCFGDDGKFLGRQSPAPAPPPAVSPSSGLPAPHGQGVGHSTATPPPPDPGPCCIPCAGCGPRSPHPRPEAGLGD